MTRAHIHEVEAPPFDAAWLRAFEASLVDDVELPAPASVIGEPVSVHAVRRLGNARAGLTARCMRGARVHEVSLADVVFAPGSAGARAVARYRAWMGLSVAAP